VAASDDDGVVLLRHGGIVVGYYGYYRY
jgi:hypothetical protein